MKARRPVSELLLAWCALLAFAAYAQTRPGADEDEADRRERAELEVKLPPYPKPGNLIRFEVSAASSNGFFIDPDSIFIGSDGIVRYTLVIKSPAGAENVSYEGMRCDMREQKPYAFGRGDGTWSMARAAEWRYIEYKDINRHHGVLYADYFCPDRKRPVKTSREAINRFKNGPPPLGSSF